MLMCPQDGQVSSDRVSIDNVLAVILGLRRAAHARQLAAITSTRRHPQQYAAGGAAADHVEGGIDLLEPVAILAL